MVSEFNLASMAMLSPSKGAGILAALFLCASMASAGNGNSKEHWTYQAGTSSKFGPANWADLSDDYATCRTGKRQSPIDIRTTQQNNAPSMRVDYHVSPLLVKNDGKTVRVRFNQGSSFSLGKDRHRLEQFHFHLPAGDKIHGEEFDLGLHFIHMRQDGHLVVVVALFRQGAENPALQSFMPHMPKIKGEEKRQSAILIDPAQFLPSSLAYYSYEGSTTAPPCTEGVTWIVLQQIQELSALQLKQLQSFIAPNARPTQALNGRRVNAVP
jgi:carbonic anhydrase